jgi:hypothetical protein
VNEEVPGGSRGTEELPDWWNDWLQMTPEQFSALLETVRKIAEQATSGKPLDIEMLRESIVYAIQWYRVDPWVEAEIDKMTIHEIAAPLDVVVAALRNDANSGVIFNALGGGDFFEGIRRRKTLVADLERLAALAAQHSPAQKPKHRPAALNLRRLVGHLANDWQVLTGNPFKSDWVCKEPISLGAQFVHAIVKVVDPSSLPQLPTATRWVVSARLRGKLPGYFGGAGRKDAI